MVWFGSYDTNHSNTTGVETHRDSFALHKWGNCGGGETLLGRISDGNQYGVPVLCSSKTLARLSSRSTTTTQQSFEKNCIPAGGGRDTCLEDGTR
jgi:hypothetical protein